MNKELKNKHYTLHGRGIHLLWMGIVHGKQTIRIYASYIIQVGNSYQSDRINKQYIIKSKNQIMEHLNNAWEYEHVK